MTPSWVFIWGDSVKQLFAILGIVVFVSMACAEGEEAGPAGPDAAANAADAPPGGFPDANMSLPDARIMADARQFPDAAPLPDAGGMGVCTTDADCGAGGCCLGGLNICNPLPVPPPPCTP